MSGLLAAVPAELLALTATGRTPAIHSPLTAIVSDAYTGGSTSWKRLYGANEFNSTWSPTAEWTTVVSYVTAQQPQNGPAMFRRESASMLMKFANATQITYGSYRNLAAGLAATTFKNKPICLLVYVHRMFPNMSIRLRIGTDTANWIYYTFQSAINMLVEGWNTLICHTSEAIGVGAAPNGQLSFQSNAVVNDAWYVGAGSFDPNTNGVTINYIAFEVLAHSVAIGNSRTHLWLEGIYIDGKDKPRVTVGFDIQTSGLDQAKLIMDKYGLQGYAAVPTGNGVTATPAYLWGAVDVARLRTLYAAGWDVLGHSGSHNQLGTYTDDSLLIGEFAGPREAIIEIGCPGASSMVATANGSYSNRMIAIAAKIGLKWLRHVTNAPMLISRGLIGLANPLIQGANPLGGIIGEAALVARFIAYLDLLELYGCSGHCYTHSVTAAASDAVGVNSATFESMMAVLSSRQSANRIEIVVPSKFVRDSAPPDLYSTFSAPSRLVLVPGASPFILQNTGYGGLCFQISSGTVTAIEYSCDGSTFDSVGQLGGRFNVSPGDQLRITYTIAPAIVQYSI